jgi:hypothetical protein
MQAQWKAERDLKQKIDELEALLERAVEKAKRGCEMQKRMPHSCPCERHDPPCPVAEWAREKSQ